MSALDRLQHWREEQEAIKEAMCMNLAFASLARPVLEQDLERARRFIAYLESRAVSDDPETGQA